MDSFYTENNFQSTALNPSREVTYPVSGIMHPVSGIPLNNKFNRVIKRTFDIILSIILIPAILSWLIPLLAILIKLDSRGPVFFLQRRNRNGGKLFTCIKFRTMVVNKDADVLVARLNDERITRFGKVLRRYHLDELPQLFNVLAGDMSIIGPRPYMIKENLYYESLLEKYSQRHIIKPGITGLAQSFGYIGSSHDMARVKKRFALDITYIHKWSMGMDIKILFRTFMMILGITIREEP